jgi:hypothetical protein
MPKSLPVSDKPTRRPRGRTPLHQRDIARAVRAVRSAGVPVGKVELDPTTGKITVHAGEPDKTSASRESAPLDQWMAKNAGQAQGN